MKDLLLKKPIFIIGSGRSGTTLLQRMLRSHSNISSPTGESHFFIPLYKYPDKYGDLSQAENVKKVLEEMRRISREFCEEDLHGLKFDT
ncbi:MAG: sulfotransferase, partial [Thiotrichaceae bacterium]|nr:sulfotransferase [Thiotrichaceae bacterium]